MSIFGPQQTQPTSRIQPVDDRSDEKEREEKRQKRTLHLGRVWDQREKGDVIPTFPDLHEGEEQAHSLMGHAPSVEEAQQFLEQLTTLEEKVAQLCFYQTEAVYDTSVQQHVELLIQAWQIGGLLFTNGQYRRQGYLIERYQGLTKSPLLIGNDFMHGLSFYFDGEELPNFQESGLERRFADLGKAVMGLNRRLRVHFQLDRMRRDVPLKIDEDQVRAFRQGVRDAHGIVASDQIAYLKTPIQTPIAPSAKERMLSTKQEATESVRIHTLHFFDLTGQRVSEEQLVKACKEQCDFFLFDSNIQDAIRVLCRAVKSGRISEGEIDRRVMKLLILKAQRS